MRSALNPWRYTALILALGLVACGGDSGGTDDGDATPVDVSDGGTDADVGEDAVVIACLSTAGCNLEAPGTICVDGSCAPCTTDDQCSGDPEYGETATCQDGTCVPCPYGELGCGCNAGECATGECVAGTCEDCTSGSLGCTCNSDGTCDVGARCGTDEVCEECPVGEAGCPCNEDELCDGDLLCIADLCAEDPCEPGLVDCPCDDDEVCEEGAGCRDDGFCYACDADGVGCACDPDDGCSDDFVCDADEEVCRRELDCDEVECLDHQLCDDADEPDGVDGECIEACESGWVWDADAGNCRVYVAPNCEPGLENSEYETCLGLNRECVAGEGTASCGDCIDYYEENDSGLCVPVQTCADIADACTDLNRGCVDETAEASAYCGDCAPLYVDGDGDACVIGNLTCADGDFSIADICAAENRVCTPGIYDPEIGSGEGSAEGSGEGTGGNAECGACISGYSENPDAGGACEELASCTERGCAALGRECLGEPFAVCGECFDGLTPLDEDDPLSGCRGVFTCEDITCGESEYCVESATGGDASCVSSECTDAQAWNGTECVDCVISCPAETEGATGRIWLYTREGSDECLCETEDGYFADPSRAALPQPCDDDDDGWVRASAKTFIESADPALAANARCSLRTIDSVILRNEWQQEYELHICGVDLVATDDLDADCEEVTPVALYESATLDDDDAIRSLSGFFPIYTTGVVGRQLYAGEVNPLTKACAGAQGDHNDNDVSDIEEFQGMDAPDGVTFDGDELLWVQLSYFTELHRGFYEPRPAEDFGAYVIAERRRCDDDEDSPFFLGYSEGGSTEYWRSCSRSRRTDYDAVAEEVGYDFAQYTCDATSGGCELPAPAVGSVSEYVDGVAVHGLCDDIPLPPEDGVWRGMNAASQFRCVQVTSAPIESWEISPDEIFDGDVTGTYEFNNCGVPCDLADTRCDLDCVEGDCLTSEEVDAQPNAPGLACEVDTAPSDNAIGFIATRFVGAAEGASYAYEEGCLDEWETWPTLCPGYIDPADVPGGAGSPATGDGLPTDFGRLICSCGVNYGGAGCDYGCPTAGVSDDFDIDVGWWFCPTVSGSSYDDVDETWGPALVSDETSEGTYVFTGGVPHSMTDGTVLCESEDCATGFVLR